MNPPVPIRPLIEQPAPAFQRPLQTAPPPRVINGYRLPRVQHTHAQRRIRIEQTDG